MGDRSSSRSRTAAKGLALFAMLCSAVALAGWTLDIPLLYRFLPRAYPIWPLTALGYGLLGAGILADSADRVRLSRYLLAIPMLIAIGTGLQPLINDSLSFNFGLHRTAAGIHEGGLHIHPGRPGVNAIVVFLMLPLALLARRSAWRMLRDVSPLIAMAPLALAVASATMLLISGDPPKLNAGLRASIPGTLMSLSLTAAVLFGRASSPARLGRVERSDPMRIQAVVAAAIILPALPAMIELAVERGPASGGSTFGQIVLVLFNLIAIGLVSFWAVRRVGREQAARAELSMALDSAIVIISDPTGAILHWSQGCEQLYGWSEREVLGQNKYMLLRAQCPDWQTSYSLPDADGAQELIERRKDGSEIHVIERLQHLGESPRPYVVVHNIIDISERVSALRALRASEERLAQATAAHELGIFDFDLASGRIEWSPGTEQRLGLAPGALSSLEAWREHVLPEDVDDLRETVLRAIPERAERFSFRYRLVKGGAAGRTLEGSARCFYDNDGALARVVGAVLDITERDEREVALRRREAQLRTVLETVPDAMIVLNAQGTILQFSTAAETLWGYRASEVVGRNFSMLIPEDEQEPDETVFRRFIETGQGLVGEVLVGTAETADGRRFPAELRAGAAKSDDDMLITVFIRDLTERVAADQRLSELNNEIAHVSRQSAMSEMAADLAHELNQPLSATGNFLAAARMLIERGESGERVTDLLRMGSEQTQRAGEIIRRLRAFVARGEVEMRVESVERTIRDAVELVLVGTGHFNLRVNLQLDPAARFVLADRIQVQQVLVNLLRNAVQALKMVAPDDRQITITSESLPDQLIAITVTDSGPGIPPHILESMFSRFSTTKGGAAGMGIGLSISKRIIEGHGGVLSAGNAPGGGASFRFTLPAVEEGEE
ncbi:PAS domain S-box protein [Sphingomonas pokkalii]|uniref:histidine kinase n=1 Tax=Sphingomonas pokkalii TaxID=2175090 RepID=A0A2U0SGF7_9SPHN|nr:PAS domain S-box protein [Sphingomonas pokkalii]PVX30448.1 PAS domain-containing sensor histidine kinase [Sphingomonas pokkalii]